MPSGPPDPRTYGIRLFLTGRPASFFPRPSSSAGGPGYEEHVHRRERNQSRAQEGSPGVGLMGRGSA